MTFDSIRSSRNTAAEVSSQEDSMANIRDKEVDFKGFYFLLGFEATSENGAVAGNRETDSFTRAIIEVAIKHP